MTAVNVGGFESAARRCVPTRRVRFRNVILYATQFQAAGSGFRFWGDLNGDGGVQPGELGLVLSSNDPSSDFFVDRDGAGDLYLTPVRAGTGVEYYDDNNPVEDLTSIDFAADRTYHTSGILAIPGYGYVFEMNGGDGFKRYGAVRLSHVGHDFLIMDWAYRRTGNRTAGRNGRYRFRPKLPADKAPERTYQANVNHHCVVLWRSAIPFTLVGARTLAGSSDPGGG